MKKVLLNGTWRLFIADEKECAAENAATLCELEQLGYREIAGSVPGNFELDMQKAGMIPELFYGTNTLQAQELENKHLWYARSFSYDGGAEDVFLTFDGIDTFADIYLNGVLLGSADNMLISHTFSVCGRLQAENELVVHIKPTLTEAQNYPFEARSRVSFLYNGGSLAVRKAPHMYGWDIMPRILSGGLWRDVYLTVAEQHRIEEIYSYTVSASEEKAEVCTYFRLNPLKNIKDYRIRLTGECGDSRFICTQKLWHNEGFLRTVIDHPKLWWPKNMGEAKLYRVSAELLHGDAVESVYEYRFGIRTVQLKRTSLTDQDGNGEFRFYINGEPMFVLGTNWVPLDAFHSRDKERLPKALELLDDIGCNMVRCWGGNVYESDAFFDFCDAHGIAVWQDFAMGCASYPQNEDFLRRFGVEAEQIIKRLRGHASLVLWAGDNECDEAITCWTSPSINPADNRITREVLPNLISRHDPMRPYLPSSPYIDETAFASGLLGDTPERHLWGPRDYFKGDFYKNAIAHFASETGYHGCPSFASIKKFISPQKLWPPYDNEEWQVHATCMELGSDAPNSYRIPLMISQVEKLWGEVPDQPENFALASQLSQAEAVKYFIEHFRCEKWRRTGIIWWNLLDGWPQFSDAVVDYYFDKKAAYYYIKRSQTPICLMLAEPENGALKLIAANELRHMAEISYKVTELTERKTVAEGSGTIAALGKSVLAELPFDSSAPRFYLMEWNSDGKKYKNHYLSGEPPFDLREYLKYAEEIGLLED